MKKQKCLICNGTGLIHRPNDYKVSKFEAKAEKIKLLRKNGYSFREIMKLMKFKSTSVVAYYLNGQNINS